MHLRINGCNVYYDVRKNTETNPILFLHGWSCDSTVFAAAMDIMSPHATIITLDFPAHGKSEEPPEPWGVKEFADTVKQLLEYLGYEAVSIVAHSFGARIALYLAANDPQMVKQMVITGGAGIRKPSNPAASKRTARYKRLKSIALTMAKIPFLKEPMRKFQNALVKRYGSEDYAKLSESMRKTFVKVISEDLSPLLTKITASTLLIWGGEDEATPLWMAEKMENDIQDAGLIVFDGRSHFAFLEESDRFCTIIKQFFLGGK